MVLGWVSVIGSFGDAALGLIALWHTIVTGAAPPSISLDAFLKEYLGFVYWVKQVAYYVLPSGFVNWLFGLPALVYFPVRILLSAVIGWWALRKAAALLEARNRR